MKNTICQKFTASGTKRFDSSSNCRIRVVKNSPLAISCDDRTPQVQDTLLSRSKFDPPLGPFIGDPTLPARSLQFPPSVFPISTEVNAFLARMLDVDWRKRMTLRDGRYAIERANNFFPDGVVFEGSMARCPWEAGM